MRIDGYPFPLPVPLTARPAATATGSAATTEEAALSPQEKLRRLLDEKRGQAGLHVDHGVSTLGQHIDLRV